MDITKLTDNFSVSPQISADDIAEITAAGYRSVLCNRPDNEDPSQPDFSTIEQAAKQAGLEIVWVPMSNQVGMTHDVVADMADALETLPKPILAYCRSGTRSSHLFMAVERMKRAK